MQRAIIRKRCSEQNVFFENHGANGLIYIKRFHSAYGFLFFGFFRVFEDMFVDILDGKNTLSGLRFFFFLLFYLVL